MLEGRKDFSPDSEQASCNAILQQLRGPLELKCRVSAANKGKNALWIVSLALTLFSAIMGVLAKAWLAKFVPDTTSLDPSNKDALNRFKLDREAEVWYPEEALIIIPFLVHIACFLFFAGLIIQVWQDDKGLGTLLIVLSAVGVLMYLGMTVLPLRIQTAPFNTPISEILLRRINKVRLPIHPLPS